MAAGQPATLAPEDIHYDCNDTDFFATPPPTRDITLTPRKLRADAALQTESDEEESKRPRKRRATAEQRRKDEASILMQLRSLREANQVLEVEKCVKEEQLRSARRERGEMLRRAMIRETHFKRVRGEKKVLESALQEEEEQRDRAQSEIEELLENALVKEGELERATSALALAMKMTRETEAKHKKQQNEALERSLCLAEQLRRMNCEKEEMLKRALFREKALKQMAKQMQMERERHQEELDGVHKDMNRAARLHERALQRLRSGTTTTERHVSSSGASRLLTWEFQGSDKKWIPYTSDNSDAITKSLMEGHRSCSIVHDRHRYEVTLEEKRMVQTNLATGRCRKMRYLAGVPQHWLMVDEDETIIQQLKRWHPGWASNAGVQAAPSGSCSLTLETILRPIREKDKLEEFSHLLRKSVFHHHKWQDPQSQCDLLKSKFEVCEAYHVQNLPLYQAYCDVCRRLRSKHIQAGVTLGSIWPDVPLQLWNFGEELGIESTGLNERVLFHGTSFDKAKEIARDGFDSRAAKPNGMYGQGTYFAAQSCKSHKYTMTGEALHSMILARVALGDPHYALRCDKSLRRPPKKDNLEGSLLCDSLIAAPGRMEGHKHGWQSHVEFIIFGQCQALPEYILRYRLTSA